MTQSRLIGFVAMAVLFAAASQAHQPGSNKNPLSFGDDQTIVDLDKVIWGPLEVDGLAPGAEIAVIRGDLAKDHSESVVRLPPGYVLRSHTHTSDELYIWISGSFTLIAHDGTETKFRGVPPENSIQAKHLRILARPLHPPHHGFGPPRAPADAAQPAPKQCCPPS